MGGDMTTDSLTTREYYRFWKDFSGNLATANISGNITLNTNSSTMTDDQEFESFISSYPWIFFFSAVAIWMLTPFWYTIRIGEPLLMLLFNWEKFKKEDDGRLNNKLMIGFLRMFNLTPEEVDSYPTTLKVALVIPPLGIVLFIALMCYSAFLAYVQFPLFAIRIALEDVYKTSSGGCKQKVDQFFRRNKTMSKMISNAKACCGLGLFEEDDIVDLKGTEAICESFFQFILSTFFFQLTKKYDLEGNILVENVFIPDNAILLNSMIMSMVSIMIAINGKLINDAKRKRGKEFYKNVGELSLIILLNLVVGGALLFLFIGLLLW